MALAEQTVAYIKSLAQTFGLDEKVLLTKAEADENARKVVDIVPRSTFSAELDKVRDKTKAEMQPEFEKWKGDYYNKEVLPRWQQQQETLTKSQSELNLLRAKEGAYRNLYGELDGFSNPNPNPNPNLNPQPQNFNADEFYSKSAATAGAIAKEMTRAGLQYYAETGKVLDVDKFEEHVVKGKYQGQEGVRRALDDFIKPEREAKASAELDARIKREREEAVKEWASQHQMPLDNAAPVNRGSRIFHPPSKDEADAALLNDPNTPRFVKDDIMRKQFQNDLGNVTSKVLAGG